MINTYFFQRIQFIINIKSWFFFFFLLEAILYNYLYWNKKKKSHWYVIGIPINLKPRRGPKIKRFLAFIFSKLTFFSY